MDFRALAELVMMSLFGLSVLCFTIGLSVRLFLAPTLRDLFGKQPQTDKLLVARITQLEDRLDSIDASLERIADTSEFDRKLEGPKLS